MAGYRAIFGLSVLRYSKFQVNLKCSPYRVLSSYSPGHDGKKRFNHALSTGKTLREGKVPIDSTNIHSNNDFDFTDFKRAYQAKTTTEIIRALVVYKLCSYESIVSRTKMVRISCFLKFCYLHLKLNQRCT